jgi:hypothetical protein
VDQVFDELDPDGGGAISIDELNKALRRGPNPTPAPNLTPTHPYPYTHPTPTPYPYTPNPNQALRRGGDAKLQMSSSGAASAIARARMPTHRARTLRLTGLTALQAGSRQVCYSHG